MPTSRRARRRSSNLYSPQHGTAAPRNERRSETIDDAHELPEPEVDEEHDEELFIELDADNEEVAKNTAEGSIGMSLEDYLAQKNVNPPSVASWKDVDSDIVTATIGEATEIVWKEGKDEIGFFRRKVFMPKFHTEKPSLKQIADLLFGPNSSIVRLFQQKLGYNHAEFSNFMRTFFVQSAYRLSATQMYSKESYIRTLSLMAKEAYIMMWKKVGKCNLPEDYAAYSHVSGQTFWAGLEAALNADLQEHVLPSFLADDEVEQFRAIFDDDKMHFNLKPGNQTASLKQSQHIRDNRKGPVCHHSVLSASGVLIGCTFERPGDKTTSCTQRIVKSQMVPMQGGDASEVQNLSRLTVGGDRAYQNQDLFFGTFIPSGARVLGTKARSRDNPFCFGWTLDSKDKQQDVPMNGAKTLMIKKV